MIFFFFLIFSINLFGYEPVYKSKSPFTSHLFSILDGKLIIGTELYEKMNLINTDRSGKIESPKFTEKALIESNLKQFAYLGDKFLAVTEKNPNLIYITTQDKCIVINDINGEMYKEGSEEKHKKIKSIVKLISSIPTQAISMDFNDQFTHVYALAINESNEVEVIVFNIPNSEELTYSQVAAINTKFVVSDEDLLAELYWDQNIYTLYGLLKSGNNQLLFRGMPQEGDLRIDNLDLDILSEDIKISKLSSLYTSTHLHYLVVCEENSVYSLPLVNNTITEEYEGNKSFCQHGLIANLKTKPEVVCGNKDFFLTRANKSGKNISKRSINSNSAPIKVGNFNLSGKITHVQSNLDCVIVSSYNPENLDLGGIFYSRSVFDNDGLIKGWTDWQRACDAKSTFGFSYDPQYNLMWHMPMDQDGKSYELVRNMWDMEGKKNLEKEITKLFDSGIYFGTSFNNILAFGGKDKLVIINQADLKRKEFDKVGMVKGLEIIKDYIIINSSNGLKISRQFEDLDKIKFKKINNNKNIKVIKAVEDKLYMLSPHKISYLNIENLDETIVFEDKNLKFYNLLITTKFILLATNKGLYRLEDNKLLQVNLPEYVGKKSPVTKIVPVTSESLSDGTFLDGNIYILNADKYYNQAQVYRFNINQDGELKLLPDCYIKDNNTFFIDFGLYKADLLDTGLVTFVRSENNVGGYNLEIMAPAIRSGHRIIDVKSQVLGFRDKNFKKFRGIFQDKTSGRLYAYGDFGLLVN